MGNLLEDNLYLVTEDITNGTPKDGFVFTCVELPKILVDKIASKEDLSVVIINSMLNSQDDLNSLLELTESQISESYIGKVLKDGLEAIGIAKTIDKVYNYNDLENNIKLFTTAINNSNFTKIEKELLRVVSKSTNGVDLLFNSLNF